MIDVSSLILAAGDSRRMGSPKALLRFGNATFLERVVGLHRELPLSTWVVLGREAELIRSRVDLSEVSVLVNPRPEEGPLSSLLLGLGEVADACGSVLVHPVDHPLVTRSTLEHLVEAHRRHPRRILLPAHGGRTGHPVLFPRAFFGALRRAPLDRGARWVVLENARAVFNVPVDDPGILRNIDTPAEYARWIERSD